MWMLKTMTTKIWEFLFSNSMQIKKKIKTPEYSLIQNVFQRWCRPKFMLFV